ncbi:L-azetidine-2-carboxylic acid acetyltransferase [Schizosaccharomyces cryophilus OY26]|uniref:L-azetidine-2-carboxylic acid acetyltransferase n=1 Tax=Schizosaccharomyces cryophilus (strain OY26 / ATCC MYA-4695 / CBS 11777 / NBRC 106824 / NRRL Y48691) TaxID=653667 RepID=S9X2S5_SCHCR|nr:L-azetidine-2-carboxylic acid acetyltransferase [Schizosaccharomyces cryophilus OY26]EPY51382.1 L-azetidine-2-carboxylic acid acetyltransferase [Schizosaccharomyces cryophilus OY26]
MDIQLKNPNIIPLWKCANAKACCMAIDGSTVIHDKPGLLSRLREILNYEIEKGDTYPIESPLSLEEAEEYFFKYCTVICLEWDGHSPLPNLQTSTIDWKRMILGFFIIKPNYPSRCSHVCNGGFLVAPETRGRGIGRVLAYAFLYFAPRMGYKSSVFNLVFATNVASYKLWDSLGFTRVGVVRNAARLKGYPKLVDAYIYQYEFPPLNEEAETGATS